jgi:cell division protein ZapB
MVERAPPACNTRLQAFPRAFRLTALVARHYSFRMTDTKSNASLDLEFKRLEKRLEELVATVHRLKDENRALRARHDALAAEKTTVMNRSEQVRTRVEAMIGRLKAMERTA